MIIDFSKGKGLIPVIIQDHASLQVLMLGYMNQEAFHKTEAENKVTFYSRSKKRLWTKGEESGNFLKVIDMQIDCDNDTLLIKADPVGPTCHTGSTSCFKEETSKGFVYAKASPVHKGRTTQLWKIEIKDENDNLISYCKLSTIIFNKK